MQPDQLDNRILLHAEMVTCHLLGGYIKILDECVEKLAPPPSWTERLVATAADAVSAVSPAETNTMLDELLGLGSYVAMGKLTALLNQAQAKLNRDGAKPRSPFAENLFMMIKQSTFPAEVRKSRFRGL